MASSKSAHTHTHGHTHAHSEWENPNKSFFSSSEVGSRLGGSEDPGACRPPAGRGHDTTSTI